MVSRPTKLKVSMPRSAVTLEFNIALQAMAKSGNPAKKSRIPKAKIIGEAEP